MPRPKTLKECTFCHKNVYRIAGHGLCANCYYREKRNGTPNHQIRERKACTVDGCENLSVAHGLCDMHYRRLKKTGQIEGEHFERWGHSRSHPLYECWRHMRRQRHPVDSRWDDFWLFLKDVGETRPGEGHRLHRIKRAEPYGPANFEWREPLSEISSSDRKTKSEYMRTYRITNLRGFKGAALKKAYGISIDEYEAMLKKQDGKCFICDEPETTIIRGQLIGLAVDHDHKTGKVRDLLCKSCNHGIGNFRDSPTLLRAAAAYLEAHAEPKPAVASGTLHVLSAEEYRAAMKKEWEDAAVRVMNRAFSETETPVAPLSLPG